MDPGNLEKDRTYYLVMNDRGILEIQYLGMSDISSYIFVITGFPEDDSECLSSGQSVTFLKGIVRANIFETLISAECMSLPIEVDIIRSKLESSDWFEMAHSSGYICKLNEGLLRKENRLRLLQKEYPEEFV